MTWDIRQGDVLDRLREMPDESVQCCVTSPPYWGLRDYGVDGQIGLEASPEEHIAKLVEVFREVRRVLRSDGVCWVNYGDAYNAGTSAKRGRGNDAIGGWNGSDVDGGARVNARGLKPKDLIGLPWMLAFALRADGWWLRSDCIWNKPNPMPESVTDRPTRAHEYVFLLSKAARYYYDAEAVRETAVVGRVKWHGDRFAAALGNAKKNPGRSSPGHTVTDPASGRNARTVWTINPQPTPEAHFATFPEALAERCILAGSRREDVVLDPFSGSGTTLLVAERLGRDSIGIELNPEYVAISERRIRAADPMAEIQLAKGISQMSLFG